MKFLIRNPHLCFWFSIPIILLIGFLDYDNAVDIAIHDTYYIMSKYDFCILVSIIFTMLGFGYWFIKFFKRRSFKWFTVIHIIITFIGVLVLLVVPYFFLGNDLASPNQILIITGLIIIFSQLFYFINILIAIFRRVKP